MVAYVDNLHFICKKKDTATIVKNKLKISFILSVLGSASEFVGMEIDYDGKKSVMNLSQVDVIGRCMK